MKKNITILLLSLTVVGAFSFKSLQPDDKIKVATVRAAQGKGENEGFLIAYGDGTSEIIPFKFSAYPGGWNAQQIKCTEVMNLMYEKGFRYAGTGDALVGIVFEKK